MVQANKMIDKVAVKVEKKHHLKNRKKHYNLLIIKKY